MSTSVLGCTAAAWASCVVEDCIDWLFNWRRLCGRYEKRANFHNALQSIASALSYWNKLSANLGI